MEGRLRIGLLGRFVVRRGDEEIPPSAFGGRLPRTLVRILLTRRGQLVPKAVLVDALWGDRPPRHPVRNLEVLVVRARRALGDASLIETGPGGYLFAATERCDVDAERFAALAAAGRDHLDAGRPAAALAALRDALDWWGGSPLPEDLYAEWAQQPRRALERTHLDALEAAAVAALTLGDAGEAVAYAESAVALEPLREAAHALLARALAASGDAAAGVATLQALRRRLAAELGLDVSSETAELELEILRDEVSITSGPVAGVRESRRPASIDEPVFVGRDAELAAVLDRVDRGRPRTVLISGSAGAGKSRLLAEAVARCAVPAVAARAFAAERDDVWGLGRSLLQETLALDASVVHVLTDQAARALAELVPEVLELRDVPRLQIDHRSRLALALEAAVRIVEAAGVGLVVVDDAQWGDATSLAWLRRVGDRTGALLAIAYRPEEAAAGTALASTIEALERRGAQRLSLGALSREALLTLIADVDLTDVIVEETDGTPLAVLEVLGALERDGVLRRAGRSWVPRAGHDAEHAREAARAGQRSAIEARADRLPPAARDELHRLALVGREVPARLLAHAAGADQRRTLEALDTLVRAGLARLGERGWTVSHDLVGETVAAALDAAARVRHHTGLATALRADGADPAEIARHLARAGDGAAAARAYADAAVAALSRFANGEAQRLADEGLKLAAGPDDAASLRLRETRGEARARSGDLAGAEADLRDVLARTSKGPTWSRILARLALLVAGVRGYAEAREHAAAAIAGSGGDRAATAHALAVAGRVELNVGNLDGCRSRITDALAIFEALGDAEGIASAVDTQAILAFEAGQLTDAVALFERAATLFTSRGDLFRAVMPLATRGRALSHMGRPERGLADADRALAMARMLDYVEGRCYALFIRAGVLLGLERVEEAAVDAADAVTLAERLEHREWLSAAVSARAGAAAAVGDHRRAEADFRSALDLAAGMPIHSTVAAAGLTRALVGQGRAREAPPVAELALRFSERNRGARHLARLAQCEVAVALGRADADELVARALAEARAGRYEETVPRLRALRGTDASPRA